MAHLDDERMIAWGLAALVVVGIIIAITMPKPSPPTLDQTAGLLKGTCETVCASSIRASSTARIDIPASAGIYTTAEAICVRDGGLLACGRCACPLVPGEVLPETPGVRGRLSADCITSMAEFAGPEGTTAQISCNVTFPQ